MVVPSTHRCWPIVLSVAFLLALSSLACAPAPEAAEPAKAPAAEAKAPAAPAAKPAATAAPAPKPAVVAAPAGKKDLIVVQGTDIEKLDPHLTTHAPDIAVLNNIYDNLIDRNAENKLIQGLATEWKTLDDFTWQFKLRKGVKFHNGEPFNAETVKFSLGRISANMPTYDPNVFVKGYFTTIKDIQVVDEYTANIITNVRDPLMPERLSFYGGQVIPREYFQKVGADEFNRKPIGSGPLKFVEWVKDDRAVFEVNKEWWGGKIDFEKVIFKPMPEAAPRVAALLRAEADIITKLPPDDVDRVNKSANAKAVGVPYAGLYVVASMYKLPFPLNNKYFYQAMSYAIDRQPIARDLWRGQGVVPNGIYPEGNWAHDPKRPPLEFNPAKAKEMLQKAGYKGEEIIFETTVGYLANDKQMTEAVVAMFKEVGINVKMEIIEYSVRAQRGRDMSFKGLWWMDPTDVYQEPDGMVYRHQGPNGKHRFDGLGLWTVPEWDRLMQEGRESMDSAKRLASYQKAEEIWLEWMPWVPVIQPVESYGTQKFINWKPMANQDFRIEDVKLVK